MHLERLQLTVTRVFLGLGCLTCVWSATLKTVKKKAQKCDYTFVVQEFDPTLCPSVIGGHFVKSHSPAMTNSSAQTTHRTNPATARSTTPDSSRFYQDGVTKEPLRRTSVTSTRDSHLTSALSDMARKIEETDAKLESTISKNTQLGASNDKQTARVEKLESQMKDIENTAQTNLDTLNEDLRMLRQNLTRMADDMSRVSSEKNYWKSVDDKLAGLMLDMTELGQSLTRHDRQLEKMGAVEKVIEVQASTEVVACSISPNATKYRDCEDYFMSGHTKSGVYYIMPLYSACSIPVFCDMDTPPGGWMVIQRRQDGTLDFNRNWTEYRSGFGSVGQEFWLGLDNMFLLSSQKLYELRIDLWDYFGSRVHATYGKFHVDGEREGYRLHVSNHSGSIPDGMQHHNTIKFSTPDRDHDTYPEYHCAKEWAAGWWFANCWFVILNGQYYNHSQVEYRGISWNEWKSEQLKMTEMKIRPSAL